MLKFLADENFNNDILDGFQCMCPRVKIIRAQDVIPTMPDPEILEWATEHEWILLTHDERTMHGYLYERVRAGRYTTGIIHARRQIPSKSAISHLQYIFECCVDNHEYDNQITHLLANF